LQFKEHTKKEGGDNPHKTEYKKLIPANMSYKEFTVAVSKPRHETKNANCGETEIHATWF